MDQMMYFGGWGNFKNQVSIELISETFRNDST